MPVVTPGGGSGGTTALTIAEVDGNPSVSANALIVSNGTLTDSGGGTATVTTGGGGGSGSVVFQEEGSAVGTGTILNFVGSAVTTTFSGGTAIATISAGGGDFPLGMAAPDTIPGSPGSWDQEWEGTADTLPGGWSWVSAGTPTFTINSWYPSWFTIERPASTNTEYKLRLSSFTMAATSGLWMKLGMGGLFGASSQYEWMIYDSTSANGYGFGCHNGNVWLARQCVSSSLSNRGTHSATGFGSHMYLGVTRNSNNWTTYLSYDGVNWTRIQSADSQTFTVDRLEMRWSNDSISGMATRASCDWIRYRTDNEFPRP